MHDAKEDTLTNLTNALMKLLPCSQKAELMLHVLYTIRLCPHTAKMYAWLIHDEEDRNLMSNDSQDTHSLQHGNEVHFI